MNPLSRRLLSAIAAGVVVLTAACSGGGDAVTAAGPAAPEGDATGVATCSAARSSDTRLGDGATLVAGFTTTVGDFHAWQQTRFPNAPKEAVTAAQLASSEPLTVCYFDGSWTARGQLPPFTREIVTVDASGTVALDLMSYREKVPVRRPARDAVPLSTEVVPGCENGACVNAVN